MAYIWKTITFPATTPSTGQHYTAPIVTVDDDGSMLLVQQLITDTSTAGPYSLTSFLVGFDTFGNTAPHGFLTQTTIGTTPNAFANSAALTLFETNDQYRVALPGNVEGGAGFFVSTDGSHWIIGRDVITAVENSTTLTITPDFVDSTIPIADSILTMYAPSRGSGEYGVAYVLQNGSGDVNLMWQGYNADNTKANASPISLTGGFVAVDATPAAAVSAAGGAFVEAYENVNGTGNHYITFDSFDLDGTFNTNIGNGTGTFNLNATNNNVTDITDIRFAQFPSGGLAAGVFSVVSSELRTDGFYHVVYRFKDGTTVVPAVLSSDTSAQHVQVSLDKTDGSTVVGWANESGNGAAHFAVFDSTGVQAGTTFSVGDSTMHFVSMSSLQDGRIEASFLKTIDAGTQTTSDVIYILDTRTPGQTLDYSAQSGAGQYNIAGTSGADTIIASDTDYSYMAGAGGGDIFEFHTLKIGIGFGVDEITDFNQGNTGNYNIGEGDIIDVSHIPGMTLNATVHVVDWGDKGTFVALDPDGATGGYSYWGIAQLDGVHASQTVNVSLDGIAALDVGVDSNQGYAGNFNLLSDSNSDLLWVNDNGFARLFEMNGASSGSQISQNLAIGQIPDGWHISGIGNFSSDLSSDILLVNESQHQMRIWDMNGSTVAHNLAAGPLPFGWNVEGIGDFNADGISDVLLRNDNGFIRAYEMAGTTSGNQLDANVAVGQLPTNWHIVGIGDFNNDGISDLAVRDDVTGTLRELQLNSAGHVAANLFIGGLTGDWHVVGVGKFNTADSSNDLLIRNDNGFVRLYELKGTSTGNQLLANVAVGQLSTDWHITGTGDFNADGVADALLRNDNGGIRIWEFTGAASGAQILANQAVGTLGADWATANHHYDLV